MKKEKTDYVIQTVAHALEVLEQFQNNVAELGIAELSRRLKLHKNKVFRLLATLEYHGFIEQNATCESASNFDPQSALNLTHVILISAGNQYVNDLSGSN